MLVVNSIASIATLILFVIYFIGKIIIIFNIKPILKDIIIHNPKAEYISKYNIIDEVSHKDGKVQGLVISKEGIQHIKVFSAIDVIDENGNFIDKQKGKLIYSKDFLNIDEAIAIYVEPGELFPNAYIEYETIDYRKVIYEWRYNLKSGVPSEFIRPKHTIKSFFYYLFT